MKVRLPCGRVFLIDEEDAHLLIGRNWYSIRYGHCWYVRGRVPGDTNGDVLLHNLIMGKKGVDHRDRDGLNNQRSNLRICSQSNNRMNTIPKVGKRFKGVFPARGKWYAMIGIGNKKYIRSRGHLTEESAARAYDDLARSLHGEFARLNFA